MQDEAYYRSQAEDARKLADRASDPDVMESWLTIADAYDALAAAARSSQVRWYLDPIAPLPPKATSES
jgi:hypothetical protein